MFTQMEGTNTKIYILARLNSLVHVHIQGWVSLLDMNRASITHILTTVFKGIIATGN